MEKLNTLNWKEIYMSSWNQPALNDLQMWPKVRLFASQLFYTTSRNYVPLEGREFKRNQILHRWNLEWADYYGYDCCNILYKPVLLYLNRLILLCLLVAFTFRFFSSSVSVSSVKNSKRCHTSIFPQSPPNCVFCIVFAPFAEESNLGFVNITKWFWDLSTVSETGKYNIRPSFLITDRIIQNQKKVIF